MFTRMKGMLRPLLKESPAAAAPKESPSAAEKTISLEPGTDATRPQFTVDATASSAPPTQANENASGQTDRNKAPAPDAGGVAVLTLGEKGEILSARGGCTAIFGREGAELVGRNIGVLLKRGLDNEVGEFLKRRRTGKNANETILLRVIVMRPDGTEFPVTITTPTLSLGTRLTQGAEAGRLRCWTLAFRGQGTSEPAQAATALPAPQVQSPPSPPPPPSGPVEQLAALQKEYGEMKNRLAAEHLAAEEYRRRHHELEQQLSKSHSELLHLKVEANSRGEQERRPEFELRAELDSAREAAGYTAAALKEEITRKEKLEACLEELTNRLNLEKLDRENRFADELAALQKARDEAERQRAAEQLANTEAKKRAEDLEKHLTEATAELQRINKELERNHADYTAAESTWRQERRELQALAQKTAPAPSVAATADQAAASEKPDAQELETLRRAHELLRQEHQTLHATLADEQQAAADAKRQVGELQSNLLNVQTELEAARNNVQKQTRENERAETAWREQFDLATARTESLEAVRVEALARVQKIEQELSAVRQERDALAGRLQTAEESAAESQRRLEEFQARLNRETQELERLTTDRDTQRAEHETAAAAWSQEQERAATEREELVAARATAVERFVQAEQDLTRLSDERNQLESRLAAEQQNAAAAKDLAEERESRLHYLTAELELVRADLERQSAAQATSDTDWRQQLEQATARAEELDSACAEATNRTRQLEEDLAVLRGEREKLSAKLKAEQLAAAEARDLAADLQSRLSYQTAEVDLTKAELDQRSADHEAAEAGWRQQMEQATAQIEEIEAARAAAAEQTGRLEQERAALQQERDRLQAKLKTQENATHEAKELTEELQSRLSYESAELDRARAELEKLVTERESTEAEWNDSFKAAKAEKEELETTWAASVERAMHFEKELTTLQQEHDQLLARWKNEQRAHAESGRRNKELESRLSRQTSDCERLQADLDKQISERKRLESTWRDELSSAKALASKLEAAWAGTTERNKRLERELATLRQERDALQAKHAADHAAAAESQRKAALLETRLTQSTSDLQRLKATVEKTERKLSAASTAHSTRPGQAANQTPTPAPARPPSRSPAPAPSISAVPRPQPARPAQPPPPAPRSATPLQPAKPNDPKLASDKPAPSPLHRTASLPLPSADKRTARPEPVESPSTSPSSRNKPLPTFENYDLSP